MRPTCPRRRLDSESEFESLWGGGRRSEREETCERQQSTLTGTKGYKMEEGKKKKKNGT